MTISQNHSDAIAAAPPLSGRPPAPSRIRSKTILVILFLLAALPAIGPLLLIREYGVDVPYWDQWDIVDNSLYVRQGGLPLSLFSQHLEHRIVVPRLIYIVLDNLTRWNQFAPMLAAFVIVCFTSLGIFLLLRFTIPDAAQRPAKVVGMWFICNLLIFSPAQFENWLWGIGVENVLPMAFIVWSVVAALSSMKPSRKMALSLALATGATFSSGNGLLVWPLVGLLWLWSPSLKALKEKKWLLLAWCAGFAVNAALYAHNYASPPEERTPASLYQMIHYCVAFLGGPFSVIPQVLQATIIGGGLLLLLAIVTLIFLWEWCIKGDFDFASRMIVWLSVAGFAVGSGVMAGLHRSGSGTWQSLSSRYSTYSLYMTVGLLNLALIAVNRWPRRNGELGRQVMTSLISAVLILQVLAIPQDINGSFLTYRDRTEAKAGLLLIRSLPYNDPVLGTWLYPHQPQLREMAESLNRIGFIHPGLVATNHANEILMKSDPNAPAVDYGCLDRAVPSGADLNASGWAVFPTESRPADAVFLTWDRFDNDPIIFAVGGVGESRGDVATVLHNEGFTLSGWSATSPLSSLPAGRVRIRAWAFDVKTCKAAQLYGELALQR
jgi:hypothetical protein